MQMDKDLPWLDYGINSHRPRRYVVIRRDCFTFFFFIHFLIGFYLSCVRTVKAAANEIQKIRQPKDYVEITKNYGFGLNHYCCW